MSQVTIKKWGNSNGVRFTREFLDRAGIKTGDTLDADIVSGSIILTPTFRHKSLRERAAYYNGQLNLSAEIDRDEPVGSEVW